MGVQQDGVVAHQRQRHEQHFQLVIHPQEHGAGYQPQDAAVYEVLGQETGHTVTEDLSLQGDADHRVGANAKLMRSICKLAMTAGTCFYL